MTEILLVLRNEELAVKKLLKYWKIGKLTIKILICKNFQKYKKSKIGNTGDKTWVYKKIYTKI